MIADASSAAQAVHAPASRRGVPRSLVAPLALVGVLALLAVAAPWIAPQDPRVQLEIVALKYHAPSLAFPFGTDGASRDVLTRVLYGARVSLSVASIAVLVSLCVGSCYGAVAAVAGGRIDQLLMRALDVALSLPRMLVLLVVGALWDLDVRGLVLLLGLTGWYGVARLVRGEVQQQLARDYLLSARATGVSSWRMLTRHVLPHLLPVLSVAASIGVASTISLEAGLSFLGFGAREPTASWGSIMRDGYSVLRSAWWLTLFPGLATLTAVVACNWLGDALRDVFAAEQVPA